MKKYLYLLLFVLANLSFSAGATIITVDNNYPSIGNYSTLQAAHDGANPGDTVYVLPSNTAYPGIDVYKKLIFLGPGFDLGQPVLKTAKISGTMFFHPPSGGSSIGGFDNYFIITADADNLAIRKNKLGMITVRPSHVGTVITQNFIKGYTSDYLVKVDSNNQVYLANNKIINMYKEPGYGFYYMGYGVLADKPSTSITIINNVIRVNFHTLENRGCAMTTTNATCDVINNIFIDGQLYIAAGTTYMNNMHNRWDLPAGNGNQNDISPDATFVDHGNSDFHLLPGSPARGSGLGGVDMGLYGGVIPFDDNGYPGIPSIYYLDVPSGGSQQTGVNVTIKAKSNF